jgi:hypothetical protein
MLIVKQLPAATTHRSVPPWRARELRGHAIKAADRGPAFGAVIGKATEPCDGDRGLIAILVALQ